ncbi:signal peptidase I [Paenibacillaceae bacterium GAS479]|nr:signal peptidase I [Paenibacillaceae bacterium GAS479]
MTNSLAEEVAGMEMEQSPGQSGKGENNLWRPNWQRELFSLMRMIVIAVAIVLLLNRFVLNLSVVEGSSMRPSLEGGDWLLVSRLAGSTLPIHRNDIIIIRDPNPLAGSSGYLVKRVIGLPGDVVELKKGQLLRNGDTVEEPYVGLQPAAENFRPITVEPGHFFVLGDNRQWRASRDSRAFGTIEEKAITGRAEVVLWPLDRAGRL